MKKECLQCGKTFSKTPYLAQRQRFCSKKCWYEWHRGLNNAQYNRANLICDYCGMTFSRIPSRIGRFNYCSVFCAHAEHGSKITGSKHPNWKGGALSGRGPSWRKTRQKILKRQDYKCADCGMTEKEHIAIYGHSLHVHHRSPYRLSLSNSQDNLIALCLKCHATEEAATRRKLSPSDWNAMKEQTKYIKELGLDKDDFARMYDACPQCGKRKAKKSKLCRKCRDKYNAKNRKSHFICPDCGDYKTTAKARRCWSCHLKLRRSGK